jgi:hypothetical protein
VKKLLEKERELEKASLVISQAANAIHDMARDFFGKLSFTSFLLHI